MVESGKVVISVDHGTKPAQVGIQTLGQPWPCASLSSLAAREAQRVIQPPQEGRGDVWGDILAHLAAKGTGPLLESCRARNDFGIAKYGRPLRYGDGRGAADQLQEALDLAAYAWRDGAVTRACRVLEMAEEILNEMEVDRENV